MEQIVNGRPLAESSRTIASVWRSEEWVHYFHRNATQLVSVPWELGPELTELEKGAIVKSVQAFQLGEGSDGKNLKLAAELWASQQNDKHYPEAIELFIGEEQRHSRELGRFLELNGMATIQKSWVDTIFRRLRRLAGLELSIITLLTAEIVAQVYYVALGKATGSTILRTICDQIIQDEAEHVRFQCERLAIIAQDRSPGRLLARHTLQRVLMTITLPIVWVVNHRAYKAGGYSFKRYANETWSAFNQAVPLMQPQSYAWSVN